MKHLFRAPTDTVRASVSKERAGTASGSALIKAELTYVIIPSKEFCL